MTRVLGVDPGTRHCGWGVVERDGSRLVHVDNGVLVLPETLRLEQRLAALLERLDAVIGQYRPETAAVEGVFQHRNARSALVLGHARGVALAALARRGVAIAEYTPQQVKKAVCGSGRAAKEQIQLMVALRLGLPEVAQVDASDAVAVALCHAQHLALGASPLPRPKRGGGGDKALLALVRRQGFEP